MLRVTPRDANYTGPGHRFCILRPELITAFCQVIVISAIYKKKGFAFCFQFLIFHSGNRSKQLRNQNLRRLILWKWTA